MTKTIEFKDDLSSNGQLVSISKSAASKFEEWQRSFKGKDRPQIKSVQKIEHGIFVVYE